MKTAWLWNSSSVIQHSFAWTWNSSGTRQPHSQAPFRLDSSALLRASLLCTVLLCSTAVCFALLHSSTPRRSASHCSGETSPVFQFSQADSFFILLWKGKVRFPSQREDGQKSPLLAPDWSILMQMRTPDPCSLAQKVIGMRVFTYIVSLFCSFIFKS